MSSLSLHNMPEKNARQIKSGRVKSKRNKTKFCKTHGCMFHTQDTHCSGCKSGLPKKKERFRKKLGCVVNVMTRQSGGIVGDTVIDTLRNMTKAEKSGKGVLFKAKDVAKLFNGPYQFSSFDYDPILMSPADKILVRVVDYWNLHEKNGFNSTIQCYWNTHHFDMASTIEDNLYYRRNKLFDKRSFKSILGSKHMNFILVWKQILSAEGPIPNPSTCVRECQIYDMIH